MRDFFDEAFVINLDVGDDVLCDHCGRDYSDSEECGGILFETRAICPKCEDEWIASAKRFGETSCIKAKCPEGVTFADWVRSIR